MFNADKIIRALQTEGPRAIEAVMGEGRRMTDQVRTDANARNVALGAGAAGLLGGALLAGGGKFGRNVATIGGLAALGTLAYQAWRKHQEAQPAGAPAPAPALPAPGTAYLPAPDDAAGQEALGKAVIRAMIAAAKADGAIDPEERRRLWAHLGQAHLDPEEQGFIFDELAKPLSIDDVAAGATSPEVASEIYAASLIAIDPDRPAEKAYLSALAHKLALPAGVVAELHAGARA